MLYSRIAAGFTLALLGATLPFGAPLAAQARQQTAQPVESQQVQVAQAVQTVTGRDADETRRAFYQVLDQYPPALGYVLRLDPTLLTNQAYLASYPSVAAFVAQAPDIPRNPGFYLEKFSSNYYNSRNESDPKSQAIAMWSDALQFVGAFAVVAAVVFALFSFLKYIVEYRRWHRTAKQNAEVHNKILDRFGSNEELLAYIDSPAGRRFLEATPIAQAAPPERSVGAPFGRILISVQLGVLLVALGAGFWFVSGRAVEEVRPVLWSLAVLASCLGVGAIGSAGVSYALSRKLGLLQDGPEPRPHSLV
jgi:hypothetical protein